MVLLARSRMVGIETTYREELEKMTMTTEEKLAIATAALEEISEGKGRYSMDHLKHAANTIEDMKALAVKALKEINKRRR